MSQGTHGNHNPIEPDERFGGIHDIYIRDPVSGIYKPRPAEGERKIEKKEDVGIRFQPLIVVQPPVSGTDWPSFGIACFGVMISIGTLFLLYLTAIYTHNQWVESKRTADASIYSAIAAQNSVSIAQSGLRQAQKQFTEDQRPYLWFDDSNTSILRVDQPGSGSNTGKWAFDTHIKNFGKSPAVKVSSTGYISVAQDPENDIAWNWSDITANAEGIYPPDRGFTKTVRTKEPIPDGYERPTHVANPESSPKGAIHILIRYYDRGGTEYSSEICLVIQANSVAKRCGHRGQMK